MKKILLLLLAVLLAAALPCGSLADEEAYKLAGLVCRDASRDADQAHVVLFLSET